MRRRSSGNLTSPSHRLFCIFAWRHAAKWHCLRHACAAAAVRCNSGFGASDERVVCGFDPVRGVLTLNEAFEPLEAPGDRIEIDTAGALRLATTEFGDEDAQSVHHHVIWGSDLDIPGGGPIRVRVTPFDRAFVAPEDPLAACEPAPPYDLEGAMPGDRGEAAESDSGVDLRGPFGERGAWATPLAPVALQIPSVA